MTTTQQNPSTTTSTETQGTQPQGFQAIPTRIRDARDGEVPPLVVEPGTDAEKAAICQGLSELGTKLAEIHRTAAEAYLSQGIYEQALPHLQAATTFSSTELEYFMQLGFVQYVCGDDIGAMIFAPRTREGSWQAIDHVRGVLGQRHDFRVAMFAAQPGPKQNVSQHASPGQQ